jgi:hypothetical protein
MNKPRRLNAINPPLGANPVSKFSETKDNWNQGDLLILHSFSTNQSIEQTSSSYETTLITALEENHLLSSQRQAEAILKKAASSPSFQQLLYPKALLTLERIT